MKHNLLFLIYSILCFGDANSQSQSYRGSSSVEHVVPPGHILQFPDYARIECLGIAPKNDGVIVCHKYKHPESRALRSFWDTLSTLFQAEPQVHGFGYVVSKTGEIIRSMYFADQPVGGYGLAESPDGSIGITYLQTPSIEKWCMYGDCVNTKLTYHDVSVKPSLLVFDTDNRMWVPFVTFDRSGEEGEGVLLLWAYMHDGSRWEVFARRSFKYVKFPHAVHIDSTSRIFVAGLTEWIFVDGPYGQKRKESLDFESVFTRIDVYRLVYDEYSEDYRREQEARWVEMHGNDPSPTEEEISSISFTASIALEVSYPYPYHLCHKPLFVLTGDGYVITSCYGEKEISIVKVGEVLSDPEMREFYSFPDMYHLSESDINGPKEANAPHPNNVVRLYSSASACVDAKYTGFYEPLETVGGIVMDPSGRSFSVLDSAQGKVYSVPWPIPHPPSEGEFYEVTFKDEEHDELSSWDRIPNCRTEALVFNAEDLLEYLPPSKTILVQELPN